MLLRMRAKRMAQFFEQNLQIFELIISKRVSNYFCPKIPSVKPFDKWELKYTRNQIKLVLLVSPVLASLANPFWH